MAPASPRKARRKNLRRESRRSGPLPGVDESAADASAAATAYRSSAGTGGIGVLRATKRGIFPRERFSIISQAAALMHLEVRINRILEAAGHRIPSRAWAVALAVLTAATGCWKEVAYDPSTRPPRKSTTAAGVDETPAVPPDSGESATSDIFGGEDSSGMAPVDASPANPAVPVAPVVPPSDVAEPRPPVAMAERQTAWTLASEWSIAAAMSGRGLPPAQYAEQLAKAGQAAQELGIVMPAMPKPPGKQLATDVAAALRSSAGGELATEIGSRLDAQAAAATRLAVTARRMLLIYTPLEADAPALARELREAGAASQLPAELWQPLVDLVSRRSEYELVKQAVFALRKSVAAHYAGTAPTTP